MKAVINPYLYYNNMITLESMSKSSSMTLEEMIAQTDRIMAGIGKEPEPGDDISDKMVQKEMEIITRMFRGGYTEEAMEVYDRKKTYYLEVYGFQIPPFPS